MALNDLNLEFEDEEEEKKKKTDAVHVDVDLEFQAPTGHGPARPSPKPVSAPEGGAEIHKIDEARGPTPIKKPQPTGAAQPRPENKSSEATELKTRLQQVEFESSVKLSNAEYKLELLTEVLSDTKLLDYQIGQVLARISTKHPETKQDALLIKKLLADFIAKKRK